MPFRQLQYLGYQTGKQGGAYPPRMPKNDEWRQWGERLRERIKGGRRTREQVAEHMDVHYSQVGHWQSGQRYPHLDEFFKLCAFLDADPREMLFGEMTIDEARRVIDQALETGRPSPLAGSGRERVVDTPTRSAADVPHFPSGTRDRAKKRKTGRS